VPKMPDTFLFLPQCQLHTSHENCVDHEGTCSCAELLFFLLTHSGSPVLGLGSPQPWSRLLRSLLCSLRLSLPASKRVGSIILPLVPPRQFVLPTSAPPSQSEVPTPRVHLSIPIPSNVFIPWQTTITLYAFTIPVVA
jgi:hypothetical protein